MTIEWMEYPVSLGDEEEIMTITWSDGSTDVIPANNGDGETIFQLPRFMDELFRVKNFNCLEGASAKFIDMYPQLFRSESGVLVLRVSSEENFLNAFICQSKDPAECLLSWMNDEIKESLDPISQYPEGSTDMHWVSVREVLAFLGTQLLDDVAPMVFDPDEEELDVDETSTDLGLIKVDLPWWYPPSREGPDFGYPACLFMPESYVKGVAAQTMNAPSVAISVAQRLSEDEWQRLLAGCRIGSIAEKIEKNIDGYRDHFSSVSRAASELGPIWLERWRNFY
jgi:hypothetical protein